MANKPTPKKLTASKKDKVAPTGKKNNSQQQYDMMKLIAGDIAGQTFEDKDEIKFVPARIPSYNRASVLGGYPTGAIYEVHGPNAGGKTVLGVEILAAAQQAGHLTSMHDHERAANDPNWLKALGLDLSKCIYRRFKKDAKGKLTKGIMTLEDSAEEINESIIKFKEAKEKGLIPPHVMYYILFDSVAAAVPAAKLAKGAKVGDANYGLTARLMSDWMQTLSALVGSTDVAVIFINQERVNVGAKPWEPKFKSYGGEALQFYAQVRIRVNLAGEVKEKVGDTEIVVVVGRKHRFTIEKNKLGYPAQQGMFYTSNGLGEAPLGLDLVRTTVEEAIYQGVIEKANGSWYQSDYFEGKHNGERQLRIFLRENPNLHRLIDEEIYKMVLSGESKLNNGREDDNDLDDE